MRQTIIAGNWKMYKTQAQTVEFVQELSNTLKIMGNKRIVICTSFTNLSILSRQLEDTQIKLGAQNMHNEAQGAFTGEISPLMLVEIGVEYVIIGHSERRQYFNETDESVNLKIKAAIENGLKPIICVGETLEQRELGTAKELVKLQVEKALTGLNSENLMNIIMAYEPIWAIGTGKTASSDDANEFCGLIRDTIADIFGSEIANNVHILYGGSVNPKNANELFNMEHIDGGLVGGASLKPEEFAKIINYEG